MSGRGNGGDLDRVEDLVRKNPGLPGILLAWAAMGGVVGPGGPADAEAFERFVKAVSIQKRLAELVKRGRIRKATARVGTQSTDQGYYPLGMRQGPRPSTAPAMQAKPQEREEKPKSRESGRAVLARLNEALGG